MNDERKTLRMSREWSGENRDIFVIAEEHGPKGEVAPTLALCMIDTGFDVSTIEAFSRVQVEQIRDALTIWLDTGRLPKD